MLVVGFYNVENVTDYISIAAFHFYPSVMLQTGVLFPANMVFIAVITTMS